MSWLTARLTTRARSTVSQRVEGLVAEREPGEQLVAESRQRDCLDPRAALEHLDVDHGANRRAQLDWITAELHAGPEGAAQLGQCPAQRAQRVVSAVEEHRRQARPAHRRTLEDEHREQSPALASPHRDRFAVAHDLGPAEQADDGAHVPAVIGRADRPATTVRRAPHR